TTEVNQRHGGSEYRHADNKGHEPPRAPPRYILIRRDIVSSFEAFRSHFKSPGNDQGNRKTEDRNHHHKPNDPIRNLEEWKNLRGNLDHKPRDNAVSNRDPINVAPLQFDEKVARVHPSPPRLTVGPQRSVDKATHIFLASCHEQELVFQVTAKPEPN